MTTAKATVHRLPSKPDGMIGDGLSLLSGDPPGSGTGAPAAALLVKGARGSNNSVIAVFEQRVAAVVHRRRRYQDLTAGSSS
jgi:hypothetical protein